MALHPLFPFVSKSPSEPSDPFKDFEEFFHWRNFKDWQSQIKIDLKETDRGLELKAEIPGVNEEDVELTLDQGTLTITGHRKEESKREGENFHFTERRYGTISRTVRLPFDPEPGSVEASLEKGVLSVTMPRPKDQKSQRNKIKIKRKD